MQYILYYYTFVSSLVGLVMLVLCVVIVGPVDLAILLWCLWSVLNYLIAHPKQEVMQAKEVCPRRWFLVFWLCWLEN